MTESIAVLGVGPSFGLGAAIGRRFARGGFRVFVGGRNTERLAGVADEISAPGDHPATAIGVDVTVPEQVTRFFAAVEIVPDVVVYNAATTSTSRSSNSSPRPSRNSGGCAPTAACWSARKRSDACWGAARARSCSPARPPAGADARAFVSSPPARPGSKRSPSRWRASSARQGFTSATSSSTARSNGERIATLAPAIAKQRGADGLIAIDDIAETFWQLHHQGRTAWTFETELRPYKEAF